MKMIVITLLALVLSTSFTTPTTTGFSSSARSGISHNVAGHVFGMFHAHRQGRGIALLWSVVDPGSVSGFEIEKSYDGDFFDPAGSMPCNSQSMLRYLDNNVYPGYIHYRIKAYLNDGSVEYSDVETVRIVQRR